MGNVTFDKMIVMINAQVHSGKDVMEGIVVITTYQNNAWATKKKGEMYRAPKSYLK